MSLVYRFPLCCFALGSVSLVPLSQFLFIDFLADTFHQRERTGKYQNSAKAAAAREMTIGRLRDLHDPSQSDQKVLSKALSGGKKDQREGAGDHNRVNIIPERPKWKNAEEDDEMAIEVRKKRGKVRRRITAKRAKNSADALSKPLPEEEGVGRGVAIGVVGGIAVGMGLGLSVMLGRIVGKK